MSVLHSISDRELKNFIRFGEKNIVEVGLVFGDCWATKAIEIAKALRDRLAKPEWVGLTEDEAIEILPVGEWEVESTLDFAKAIEDKLKEKNS